MPKFLIDINLPYYFSLWNSPEFIHQKDLNSKWSDEEIWGLSQWIFTAIGDNAFALFKVF